jgi:hypothetical protein
LNGSFWILLGVAVATASRRGDRSRGTPTTVSSGGQKGSQQKAAGLHRRKKEHFRGVAYRFWEEFLGE